MECGCLRAYSLTAAGARLSEFPSRNTGFTALPSTLEYFVFMDSSLSSLGVSG